MLFGSIIMITKCLKILIENTQRKTNYIYSYEQFISNGIDMNKNDILGKCKEFKRVVFFFLRTIYLILLYNKTYRIKFIVYL